MEKDIEQLHFETEIHPQTNYSRVIYKNRADESARELVNSFNYNIPS